MKKIVLLCLLFLLTACGSNVSIDLHVKNGYMDVQENHGATTISEGYSYEFIAFCKKDLRPYEQTDITQDPYVQITTLDKTQISDQSVYKMNKYIKADGYKAYLVQAISQKEVSEDDLGDAFFAEVDPKVQKTMHVYMTRPVWHYSSGA